ncbi:DUF3267 domain-containing protein [Streptococcus hongkongensis]
MHQKKLILALNLLAFPLLIFFIFLFTILSSFLGNVDSSFIIELHYSTLYIFPIFFLWLILIFVSHELVHGLFFKFFKPANKLKFGIIPKALMAYCISPGSIYKRHQMVIIGIAPFILISLFLTILYGFNIISSLAYISLASLHASGCIGDFYYLYILIFKYRHRDILTEDTITGLIIYSKD